MENKIIFRPEGAQDEAVEFYVLEQTRINGTDYLLVTDAEEGDGEALILKDLAKATEEESIYVIVDAQDELQAVGQVFQSMMDDITLE